MLLSYLKNPLKGISERRSSRENATRCPSSGIFLRRKQYLQRLFGKTSPSWPRFSGRRHKSVHRRAVPADTSPRHASLQIASLAEEHQKISFPWTNEITLRGSTTTTFPSLFLELEIWSQEEQTLCFTFPASLDVLPLAGRGRFDRPCVGFVHEQISPAALLTNSGSDCLRVSIGEAGVHSSFDFVKHIQTEGGLHLLSRHHTSPPLGPGAYLRFDSADASSGVRRDADKSGGGGGGGSQERRNIRMQRGRRAWIGTTQRSKALKPGFCFV